jgi:chaperonin GroES
MDLQPLGDRLIVEALEDEDITASGIVLPDTAKEKPQRGRVLAGGPGPRDEDGNYIKMELEEGDEIIFSKYGGTDIKLGVDEYLILRESDVLAKVVTTAGRARRRRRWPAPPLRRRGHEKPKERLNGSQGVEVQRGGPARSRAWRQRPR